MLFVTPVVVVVAVFVVSSREPIVKIQPEPEG